MYYLLYNAFLYPVCVCFVYFAIKLSIFEELLSLLSDVFVSFIWFACYVLCLLKQLSCLENLVLYTNIWFYVEYKRIFESWTRKTLCLPLECLKDVFRDATETLAENRRIDFLVKEKDCIPLRHQTDKLKIERKYESNNRT